ncbi:glycogen/starch synthase, partial [Candidatus Woesearchaeota archaeon]|nr:glycogen/starch synthase [Candidatus Woesearchaeota archaeon]
MLKVLMLGWEFPPMYSGGLGTACFGLTKALAKEGVEVTFIMPKGPDHNHDHLKLLVADNLFVGKINLKGVDSL